jgi:hypothetical protein
MSILPASGIGDESTGFYNDVIDQSIRFDDGDSPRLSKTFGSGGSRTTFTFATWVKRAQITTDMLFFHSFGPTGFGIEGFIGFTSQDLLSFQFDYNSGNPRRLVTNRVFRDVANWYHICAVADSTNSTSGDRLRLYINGVRETDFYDADYPSSSQNGTLNQAYSHYISGRTNNTSFFDGNLAEVNFLDGVAVTDTSGVLDEFIEIKNGVCIPKEVSGLSYGTTGFRFTFSDRSSQSALGTDTSGNSNDFAVSGLVDIDQSQDTPEVNLATFNSLYRDFDSTPTYSAANLRMDATSSSWFNAVSTISVSSGKWYVEFLTKSSTAMFVNIMEADKLPTFYPAYHSFGYAYYYNGQKWNDGSGSSYGDSYTNGDIIGVALDMDNGNVYFYKNGTVQNSGTAAFTGLSGDFVIGVSTSGTSGEWTANFGSDGSFNNRRGFGTNSDDNGIGQFVYSPPSGYLALCSANLPQITISPAQSSQADDHFNTVLYTGNASNTHQITGVGFQPDWLWIKIRSLTGSHSITDSVRGLGTGDSMRQLVTNNTTVEYTAENDQVRSFDADGFTLDDNTDNTWYVNLNNHTFVAWNWKAGGAPSADNSAGAGNTPTANSVKIDGSNLGSALAGTIPATRLSANTTAGFSIVTYTGTGSAGTIGHGLGKVPKWILIKNRDSAKNWIVYHAENTTAPETDYLHLNTTNMTQDSAIFFNDTAPTSSVITLGTGNNVNDSGDTYVAYVFAEIDGYSKFGGYTGNGSTAGVFVYTQFRPAWIMIKRTGPSGTSGWSIFDIKRDAINPVDTILQANTNGTDGTSYPVDFLSNGFKLRTSDSTHNQNGSTYIFMAFAELPLKFSNSR